MTDRILLHLHQSPFSYSFRPIHAWTFKRAQLDSHFSYSLTVYIPSNLKPATSQPTELKHRIKEINEKGIAPLLSTHFETSALNSPLKIKNKIRVRARLSDAVHRTKYDVRRQLSGCVSTLLPVVTSTEVFAQILKR